MKTKILAILSTLCVFALSACSSLSNSGISADQGAAALRVATSTGATLALNKNPSYLPVANALIAGIDAAVTKDVVITPAVISDFVKTICSRYNLPPADTAVFINLAQAVYSSYVTAYKPTVVQSTNPTVLLYISAFKTGLGDAVAAVKSANE